MKIKELETVEVTMSIDEVKALAKFLGGTSVLDRENAGCTNKQANILSEMFSALDGFLEAFS